MLWLPMYFHITHTRYFQEKRRSDWHCPQRLTAQAVDHKHVSALTSPCGEREVLRRCNAYVFTFFNKYFCLVDIGALFSPNVFTYLGNNYCYYLKNSVSGDVCKPLLCEPEIPSWATAGKKQTPQTQRDWIPVFIFDCSFPSASTWVFLGSSSRSPQFTIGRLNKKKMSRNHFTWALALGGGKGSPTSSSCCFHFAVSGAGHPVNNALMTAHWKKSHLPSSSPKRRFK